MADCVAEPWRIFTFAGETLMSQIALRLPDSLHQYAKQLAALDDSSLNQFIVTAVAEKISARNTEAFFLTRAEQSNPHKARAALAKVSQREPLDGDAQE